MYTVYHIIHIPSCVFIVVTVHYINIVIFCAAHAATALILVSMYVCMYACKYQEAFQHVRNIFHLARSSVCTVSALLLPSNLSRPCSHSVACVHSLTV